MRHLIIANKYLGEATLYIYLYVIFSIVDFDKMNIEMKNNVIYQSQ